MAGFNSEKELKNVLIEVRSMRESSINSSHIYELIKGAVTDDINNREIFMKGIDYSYYSEQAD